MSRYIEAEALIARIAGQMSYEIEVETGNETDCVDLAEELLNDIPSIDIAFCKDCKLGGTEDCPMDEIDDEYFCNFGEREGE